MKTTSSLKVKFLGVIPRLEEKSGKLSPEQIVSLSALLTFKGESIKKILDDIKKEGTDLNSKVKTVIIKSALRGHASMATTPAIAFSYEATKFLDSALTGIYFGSALMASGRRTNTTVKDIIFPESIAKKQKAAKIYQEASEKLIQAYDFLLKSGVQKDETSKTLQYGIYGTGLMVLPLESLVAIKREYEREKEWMPEEIGMLIKEIEKYLDKEGLGKLYQSRFYAPRNIYSYPNIFKNPKDINLTRELREKNRKVPKVISLEINPTLGFRNRLKELEELQNTVFKSGKSIESQYQNLISERGSICRDYNALFNVKILSSVPWRVWGDKKRHRTCPQIVESVYFCAEKSAKILNSLRLKIKERKLTKKELSFIEQAISLPPTILSNNEYLYRYLEAVLNAFSAYNKLLKLGIKPRDAVFIIPRGLKIDVLQEFNLYNLLVGYYPLRLCRTAEEELRRNT
ncbi:MAG: FAD-dependent thymidylate synthase, partial [Candidatus Pacebacteria bacterium]|nr:FAD-dependent thymidylate synthase [Candidatus Paceibacterota bacterium]